VGTSRPGPEIVSARPTGVPIVSAA
jgi:hypothetical protein